MVDSYDISELFNNLSTLSYHRIFDSLAKLFTIIDIMYIRFNEKGKYSDIRF